MHESGFPVIEVEGTFYDMGFLHGSRSKNRIESSLECLNKALSPLSLEDSRVRGIVEECLPPAKRYAPELVEEVRGIAEGSGVNFEQVFALNCFSEIWYSAIFSRRHLADGCTTFGVTHPATSDNEICLVWNCDVFRYWEDVIILIKFQSREPTPRLMFSYAGVVGANAGISKDGMFALAPNGIVSKGRQHGVPYSFICRKALQQRRVGDAIEAILTAERSVGSSKNFMLADASGELYSIETSSDDYEVILPVDGYIAHSNHYTTSKMKQSNPGYARGTSESIVRLGRIKSLLKRESGRIDLRKLKEFARDHVNYPLSICRHVSKEAVNGRGESAQSSDLSGLYLSTTHPEMATSASMIFQLRESRVLVAKGNPCENQYFEVDLGVEERG